MAERALGPRELARLTGVSTDTLRHYERKRLLPKVHRTASGYRRYPAGVVVRVQLIQRALVVGFSLDELARVFSERDRGGAPCRGVRALVGRRLEGLDRQIDELIALRADLRAMVVEWDARLARTPEGRRANLLDTLAERTIAAPSAASPTRRAGWRGAPPATRA